MFGVGYCCCCPQREIDDEAAAGVRMSQGVMVGFTILKEKCFGCGVGFCVARLLLLSSSERKR